MSRHARQVSLEELLEQQERAELADAITLFVKRAEQLRNEGGSLARADAAHALAWKWAATGRNASLARNEMRLGVCAEQVTYWTRQEGLAREQYCRNVAEAA